MRVVEIVKQKVLGTVVGRFLSSTRETYQIVHAAFRSLEGVGTVANDRLATLIVCGLCPPGKIFVDVGAHIGSVITAALRREPSISVIAIEAIPDKVIALKKKFPNIIIHECAVGEREGSASFYIDTKRSGYSSLSSENSQSSHDVKIIEVEIHTLDSIITDKNVEVIKIDVEGAELGVIRGATRLISECRPSLMFESAPGESLGYTKEALWRSLTDLEYSIVVPNRVAHVDPGLTLDGFLESHLYPRRSTNYFGIPRERRDEVRWRARRLQRLPE
jgi:FkbM family methyltransferase